MIQVNMNENSYKNSQKNCLKWKKKNLSGDFLIGLFAVIVFFCKEFFDGTNIGLDFDEPVHHSL
jgi:hypothetical protein